MKKQIILFNASQALYTETAASLYNLYPKKKRQLSNVQISISIQAKSCNNQKCIKNGFHYTQAAILSCKRAVGIKSDVAKKGLVRNRSICQSSVSSIVASNSNTQNRVEQRSISVQSRPRQQQMQIEEASQENSQGQLIKNQLNEEIKSFKLDSEEIDKTLVLLSGEFPKESKKSMQSRSRQQMQIQKACEQNSRGIKSNKKEFDDSYLLSSGKFPHQKLIDPNDQIFYEDEQEQNLNNKMIDQMLQLDPICPFKREFIGFDDFKQCEKVSNKKRHFSSKNKHKDDEYKVGQLKELTKKKIPIDQSKFQLEIFQQGILYHEYKCRFCQKTYSWINNKIICQKCKLTSYTPKVKKTYAQTIQYENNTKEKKIYYLQSPSKFDTEIDNSILKQLSKSNCTFGNKNLYGQYCPQKLQVQCDKFNRKTKDLIQRFHQEYPPTYVKKSTIKQAGNGLFTKINLKNNTLIGIYTGKVVTMFDVNQNSDSLYQLGWFHGNGSLVPLLIDGRISNNGTRFMNSLSKQQNNVTAIKGVFKKELLILMITTKQVSKDQELFVDYGENYFDKK